MLQNRTGKPAISHQLSSAESGKPRCVDGPAVSITHAGDYVACSIAEHGDIGIDLEVVNERRDTSKVASKFFSDEEAGWLETQPADRFYMLWVLKEAYVKAIGRSIFGGINRLRCRVLPPVIEALSMGDPMRSMCLFAMGDQFLALATTKDTLAGVEIERWDADTGKLLASKEFHLLAKSSEHKE